MTKNSLGKIQVNIGCGNAPTSGWVNLDNSPSIKLARSPFKYFIFRALSLLEDTQIKNIEWNRKNAVGFVDATKPLPFDESSIDTIYSNHMLEHLHLADAQQFLHEAYRVLKPGGQLRVGVPDLQKIVSLYEEKGDAHEFMRKLLVQAPPFKTFMQKIKLIFSGYRHHQWMYDGESLGQCIRSAGFVDVKVYQSGTTDIQNPGSLNLHEREEETVFVEGVKPLLNRIKM